MARYLAIDWDQDEARYVVANTQGARVVVEVAGQVALDREAAGERTPEGGALSDALMPHKITRATALVVVDRSQIEMVSLTLPPASDAELPQMVRNEAMRAANTIAEDTALDFVTLSDDATEPRRVSAMAMTAPRLAYIQKVCGEIGVTAKSLGVRALGAAGLLGEAAEKAGEPVLLINVFGAEVDLAIVAGDKVLLWRTLRQANVSHDAAAARRLLVELNRTLVVAQGQGPGNSVRQAYLLGAANEHPELLGILQSESSLSVSPLDPFAETETSGEVPEQRGRFAPLLGMLVSEARRSKQTIDFLHPRKPPAAPNRRRLGILAGSAAAAVVLLLGYHVYSTLAEVDAENETLATELKRLDDQFKQAGKKQKMIQGIRDWQKDDVNWLDELRDLSLRFPSGRDAVVLRMGLSHSRGAGGSIEMVGLVRDPAIVSRIESQLRDKYHQISSRHVQERLQEASYTWHFESSLLVAPRAKQQYVSHLPPEETEPEAPTPPKTPPRRIAPPRAGKASAEKDAPAGESDKKTRVGDAKRASVP